MKTFFSFPSFRLHKCNLEGNCFDALAVALSREFTQLKELDLSANNFQKAGLKALCVGLCTQHCKLETVRLELLPAEKLALIDPNVCF